MLAAKFSYKDICELISNLDLAENVKKEALSVYMYLFAAGRSGNTKQLHCEKIGLGLGDREHDLFISVRATSSSTARLAVRRLGRKARWCQPRGHLSIQSAACK